MQSGLKKKLALTPVIQLLFLFIRQLLGSLKTESAWNASILNPAGVELVTQLNHSFIY